VGNQRKVLDECAWCHTPTWCFPMSKGPMCGSCHVQRFFERVLYAPSGWHLYDWQKQVLRGIYGPVSPKDGRRLVEQAYASMAKKQGKTFLVAGCPIYHLRFPDEDRTVKVFGAAAAKDQAALIFDTAAMMINQSSDLRHDFRVLDGTKRILRRDGRGLYRVISAEGDVQDGIEPDLAIKDEYHRWKTASAKTLDQVMTKGMLSRPNALEIIVSTVGVEHESPMWYAMHEKAKRYVNGTARPENFYAAIWAADEKRYREDPEYWKSREARVAANPSHEDRGGFMLDSKLVTELEKAIENPADKLEYVRYCLNIGLATGGVPVIDMDDWQDDQSGVDLRTWPTYDVELLISKWGLAEQTCYAGVDASWTSDLTALQLIFPPFSRVEAWTFLGFAWLPKERIPEIERRVREPLTSWVSRGFLGATEGDAVDLEAVMQKLRWAREMFDLQEVGYDRCNFRHQAINLEAEGFKCPEVRQGYMSLNEATKWLMGAYTARQIRHGNHPVTNWCASCLSLMQDNKDLVQPRKPQRLKSTHRIDMISAAVTGLSRALLAEGTSEVRVRMVG